MSSLHVLGSGPVASVSRTSRSWRGGGSARIIIAGVRGNLGGGVWYGNGLGGGKERDRKREIVKKSSETRSCQFGCMPGISSFISMILLLLPGLQKLGTTN